MGEHEKGKGNNSVADSEVHVGHYVFTAMVGVADMMETVVEDVLKEEEKGVDRKVGDVEFLEAEVEEVEKK